MRCRKEISRRMKKAYVFCICLCFACTCLQATDYSRPENWAALPDRKDNADWVPPGSGLQDEQAVAEADVFFIHPTTDLTGFSGNADIDDHSINKRTDDMPVKYQASVFNGSCRIYAPRYRQATLNNYFARNSERSQHSFDVAYADVRAAFEYYLEHYNHGRPIIIAGHSQGSMHAQRLLREFFDGKPLQKQLVEAYIIGYPTQENQFQSIKVSNAPADFGGFVSYCTFGMDADISFLPQYKGAVVVNPLSWSTDKTFVAANENHGSLLKKSEKIVKALCGARCGDGILEIQKPSEGGFTVLPYKNYHLYDYALFYLNIRENVALRLKNYLDRQGDDGTKQ